MNKVKPHVSVIIPTYNGSKTIRQSLESVLRQSYDNFEVIVVDNNSNDNTKDIVAKISELDKRVKLIKCETQGIVPALNTGIMSIEKSTKYIARQDDDDIWYESKLQKQVEFLERNNEVDILGTDILINNLKTDSKEIFSYPATHSECMEWFQTRRNPICHPSVVFRKSIIDRAGLYDDRFPFAEDMSYWLKASYWYKLGNLKEELMQYNLKHNEKYNPSVNTAVLISEGTFRNCIIQGGLV